MGRDPFGDEMWRLYVRPGLAGAAAVVAFVLLVLVGTTVRDRLVSTPPTDGAGQAGTGIGPAGTPVVRQTASPANATPVAGTPVPIGRRLVVAGTEGLGLTLRDEPAIDATTIAALTEGALLTEIGAGRTIDGRAWLRVRDESGREGWVAAEFTAAAP